MSEIKCECGEEIVFVCRSDSGKEFWRPKTHGDINGEDGHWHKPAEPVIEVAPREPTCIHGDLDENGKCQWCDGSLVPAVPAQEAPREICPACGSSFKSVRQFAYSTDRTARAPCGDKWHEPQAGAQVPSQDGRPGTVGYVLANLDSIFDSYCFCPDAKSWIICILIAQLRSIQSYATEAAKTPITREDMHDPLKAQTFFDEAKGFERLVLSETK